MTREEAKEILTHNWTRVDNPNYSELELDEAFFMAIEALTLQNLTEPNNTCEVDLISRADAIKAVAEHFSFDDGCSNIYKDIDYYKGIAEHILKNVPSADAETDGEWEHWGSPFSDESEVIDTIVCSVCGARFIEPKDEPKGEYNYCPNCGAKMIKGGDD